MEAGCTTSTVVWATHWRFCLVSREPGGSFTRSCRHAPGSIASSLSSCTKWAAQQTSTRYDGKRTTREVYELRTCPRLRGGDRGEERLLAGVFRFLIDIRRTRKAIQR